MPRLSFRFSTAPEQKYSTNQKGATKDVNNVATKARIPKESDNIYNCGVFLSQWCESNVIPVEGRRKVIYEWGDEDGWPKELIVQKVVEGQ